MSHRVAKRMSMEGSCTCLFQPVRSIPTKSGFIEWYSQTSQRHSMSNHKVYRIKFNWYNAVSEKCEFCSQLSSTRWSPNVSAMPQSAVNCVTIRQRESIPQCQWRQWSFNQMEKVQISADGSRPLFVNCSFMSMRNNMKTTSAWDLELPARLSYAPARFCPLNGQVGAILPSAFFIIIHHPSSIIHHPSSIIHHHHHHQNPHSSFFIVGG